MVRHLAVHLRARDERYAPLMDRPLALRLLAAVALLLAACAPGTGPDGSGATGTLVGRALAGPTCPVVSASPDPACADRPVAGATLVVRDGTGREVARLETGPDGTFAVELPPGRYAVTGEPVEGLMHAPGEPVEATVIAGARSAEVLLSYDTGIR